MHRQRQSRSPSPFSTSGRRRSLTQSRGRGRGLIRGRRQSYERSRGRGRTTDRDRGSHDRSLGLTPPKIDVVTFGPRAKLVSSITALIQKRRVAHGISSSAARATSQEPRLRLAHVVNQAIAAARPRAGSFKTGLVHSPSPISASSTSSVASILSDRNLDAVYLGLLPDEAVALQIYEPSAREVTQYAVGVLGMDQFTDTNFFWIAQKALTHPIPPGWRVGVQKNVVYFFHPETERITFADPSDRYYRDLYQREKVLARISDRKKSAHADPGVFDACHAGLTDDMLKSVLPSLDENTHSVLLSGNKLSIMSLAMILTEVRSRLRHIVRIDIDDNERVFRMDQKDVHALERTFDRSNPEQFASIQYFSLQNAVISPHNIATIIEKVLIHLPNLETVDLRGISLTSESLKHLCRLAKTNSNIVKIDIESDDNNTPEALAAKERARRESISKKALDSKRPTAAEDVFASTLGTRRSSQATQHLCDSLRAQLYSVIEVNRLTHETEVLKAHRSTLPESACSTSVESSPRIDTQTYDEISDSSAAEDGKEIQDLESEIAGEEPDDEMQEQETIVPQSESREIIKPTKLEQIPVLELTVEPVDTYPQTSNKLMHEFSTELPVPPQHHPGSVGSEDAEVIEVELETEDELAKDEELAIETALAIEAEQNTSTIVKPAVGLGIAQRRGSGTIALTIDTSLARCTQRTLDSQRRNSITTGDTNNTNTSSNSGSRYTRLTPPYVRYRSNQPLPPLRVASSIGSGTMIEGDHHSSCWSMSTDDRSSVGPSVHGSVTSLWSLNSSNISPTKKRSSGRGQGAVLMRSVSSTSSTSSNRSHRSNLSHSSLASVPENCESDTVLPLRQCVTPNVQHSRHLGVQLSRARTVDDTLPRSPQTAGAVLESSHNNSNPYFVDTMFFGLPQLPPLQEEYDNNSSDPVSPTHNDEPPIACTRRTSISLNPRRAFAAASTHAASDNNSTDAELHELSDRNEIEDDVAAMDHSDLHPPSTKSTNNTQSNLDTASSSENMTSEHSETDIVRHQRMKHMRSVVHTELKRKHRQTMSAMSFDSRASAEDCDDARSDALYSRAMQIVIAERKKRRMEDRYVLFSLPTALLLNRSHTY